eukprot:13302942-Ditylum_brightwellii.AAC.1
MPIDYNNTRLWELDIEAVMIRHYAVYVTAIVKASMLCKFVPAVLLPHGIKSFEVSVADAAAEIKTGVVADDTKEDQ